MRRALLLLILLAPAALAASGTAVHGRVDLVGDVQTHGLVAVRGSQAVLGLVPLQGHGITLDVRRALGEVVDRHRNTTPLMGVGGYDQTSVEAPYASHTPLRFDEPARLSIVCDADCILLFVADAPLGVDAQDAASRVRAAPHTYSTATAGQGPDSEYVVEVPAGGVQTEGRAGTPALPAHARLVLRNAALETPRGAIETFGRQEPREGFPGQPALTQQHTRWLWLDVEDARVEGAAPFILDAPATTLDLQGFLAAPGASGDVWADGRHETLAGATLAMAGHLTFDLAPRPNGVLVSSFGGTATQASAGGADILAGWGTQKAALAGGATLVGLLAVAGALVLYTRIAPSRALKHPMRQRIHALLLERPAATTADLVRWTGARRIVVRHHLRMLENSGHVASQRHGASRCYHVVGEIAPREVERALSVRDPTRRSIATLLADAPEGLTQRELVERTGLSQRLVSYHLGRLEQAGFLAPHDEATPRRYRACSRMPVFPPEMLGN